MKKLRLAVDELRVESFGTAADRAGEAGTVYALATGYTRFPTCLPAYTCPECAPPE